MAKTAGQLKKLAKLAGFDADSLVAEIAGEVALHLPPPQAIDVAQITQDVANQVNAQQAAKLEQILEAVKSGSGSGEVDTSGIIQGVAKILQPQLMAAIRETSEATFRQNAQSLVTQINAGVEERLKKNSDDGDTADRTGVDSSPRAGGGFDLGGLVAALLNNSDKIKELVSVFKPTPSANELIGQQIGNIFKWHQTLKRLESGQASVEEIQKGIIDLNKSPTG